MLRSALSYILISINKNFHLEIKYDYIMILVLVIVLFINPFNIYNLGFQYSYLISFVLVKCRSIITGNYLKKMLLVKDLDKITITDITNDCEMNRQTFYYHFKDIYDLLEWIFANEVVEKIEKETTIETWQENFKYVLDYMLKNKKFIIKTYNSLSRKTLIDFLFKQYNTIFIEIVNDISKNYNITRENKVFIANFYKYGFAGIIENWIVTEMKESPESIIKKLDVMISGSFEEAVKKMSN